MGRFKENPKTLATFRDRQAKLILPKYQGVAVPNKTMVANPFTNHHRIKPAERARVGFFSPEDAVRTLLDAVKMDGNLVSMTGILPVREPSEKLFTSSGHCEQLPDIVGIPFTITKEFSLLAASPSNSGASL
jgi:hypothetical protein